MTIVTGFVHSTNGPFLQSSIFDICICICMIKQENLKMVPCHVELAYTCMCILHLM